MGKTKTLEIQGNPNVGLFGYTTNKYCLVGKNLNETQLKVFETSLDVPVHSITIDGSSQIGVYLNGNETCLLVPSIITKSEIDELNKLGIKFKIIDTKETALGNNLIIGENYFFYHVDFEDTAIKQIEDSLGINGEAISLEDWEVIGSICCITSKGGLIQNEVPEEIKLLIEKKLNISLERGTLNFGSRIISGCLVANDKGMVIGKASAGIEITNADMALGFLEK